MEKIKVKQQISFFNSEVELDGDLSKVIDNLKFCLKQGETQGYSNLTLEREYFSEHVEINLYGLIEETDEEFEIRKKAAAKLLEKQSKQTEKERKMYERLKKKFETNG